MADGNITVAVVLPPAHKAIKILGDFATWTAHNIGRATYAEMRATPIWHEVSALLADAAGIRHKISVKSDREHAYEAWLALGQNFELGRFAVTPVAFEAGFDAGIAMGTPTKLDASGTPMLPATLLEQQAIRALNMVKAWRDSDGNEPFPHEARELIDALLMMAEQRRTGIAGGPAA